MFINKPSTPETPPGFQGQMDCLTFQLCRGRRYALLVVSGYSQPHLTDFTGQANSGPKSLGRQINIGQRAYTLRRDSLIKQFGFMAARHRLELPTRSFSVRVSLCDEHDGPDCPPLPLSDDRFGVVRRSLKG